MKELTIEQKAQRYDEALKRYKAKQVYESQKVHEFIEYLFPELKESEDEKIKQDILAFIRREGQHIDKYKWHKWIAWLEKQGERKSIDDLTQQEAMDIAVAKCFEQDEQKSVDKTEPKFHEGKWVVFNEHHNSIYQVEKIQGLRYYLRHYTGGSLSVHIDNQLIRPWTIQDANAGDVLEFGDHGRLVVGIVSYVNKTTGKVDVSCLLEDNKFKIGIYYALDTINPHPATKEQRDTLFAKMKEAGYEWNIENKELKKIEQKPAKKQGKHKSDDKVEPKFKTGDWVVNTVGDTNQVVKVWDDGYTLDDNTFLSNSWATEHYHLWTIQDANAGDVLEFGDHGRLVVGIVSYVNKTTGKVDVSCLLEGDKFKIGVFYNLDTVNPHPSTKEQRDLLFQKMKEAGYEWDADKKQLKKIEQNHAWSEEDESIALGIEQVMNCASLLNIVPEKIDKIRTWLKSLKERVQPQPKKEWSEEDEAKLKSILFHIEDVENKDVIDWLKSLRPQSQWKPSDEQIGVIEAVINNRSFQRRHLDSLYEQLKKLREK